MRGSCHSTNHVFIVTIEITKNKKKCEFQTSRKPRRCWKYERGVQQQISDKHGKQWQLNTERVKKQPEVKTMDNES